MLSSSDADAILPAPEPGNISNSPSPAPQQQHPRRPSSAQSLTQQLSLVSEAVSSRLPPAVGSLGSWVGSLGASVDGQEASSGSDLPSESLLHLKLREKNASLRRAVGEWVGRSVGAVPNKMQEMVRESANTQTRYQVKDVPLGR